MATRTTITMRPQAACRWAISGVLMFFSSTAGCAEEADRSDRFADGGMLRWGLLIDAVAVQANEPGYADAGLLQATGKPGEGKLSAGIVVKVLRDQPVWRLWDRQKMNQGGQWWSFEKPSGTLDRYRYDYQICDEWSRLDRVRQCTLRAGSMVVIGPGQSAICQQLIYPQSDNKYQMFIVDPASVVTDCVCYAECADEISERCDVGESTCCAGADEECR